MIVIFDNLGKADWKGMNTWRAIVIIQNNPPLLMLVLMINSNNSNDANYKYDYWNCQVRRICCNDFSNMSFSLLKLNL